MSNAVKIPQIEFARACRYTYLIPLSLDEKLGALEQHEPGREAGMRPLVKKSCFNT